MAWSTTTPTRCAYCLTQVAAADNGQDQDIRPDVECDQLVKDQVAAPEPEPTVVQAGSTPYSKMDGCPSTVDEIINSPVCSEASLGLAHEEEAEANFAFTALDACSPAPTMRGLSAPTPTPEAAADTFNYSSLSSPALFAALNLHPETPTFVLGAAEATLLTLTPTGIPEASAGVGSEGCVEDDDLVPVSGDDPDMDSPLAPVRAVEDVYVEACDVVDRSADVDASGGDAAFPVLAEQAAGVESEVGEQQEVVVASSEEVVMGEQAVDVEEMVQQPPAKIEEPAAPLAADSAASTPPPKLASARAGKTPASAQVYRASRVTPNMPLTAVKPAAAAVARGPTFGGCMAANLSSALAKPAENKVRLAAAVAPPTPTPQAPSAGLTPAPKSAHKPAGRKSVMITTPYNPKVSTASRPMVRTPYPRSAPKPVEADADTAMGGDGVELASAFEDRAEDGTCQASVSAAQPESEGHEVGMWQMAVAPPAKYAQARQQLQAYQQLDQGAAASAVQTQPGAEQRARASYLAETAAYAAKTKGEVTKPKLKSIVHIPETSSFDPR